MARGMARHGTAWRAWWAHGGHVAGGVAARLGRPLALAPHERRGWVDVREEGSHRLLEARELRRRELRVLLLVGGRLPVTVSQRGKP
eukprot:1867524-Prymnesium_polylepis.1